jgi:CheY-like chemotaxis protein
MARILLVEDDESLRKALRLTLIHMGHSVVEARDGKEASKLSLENIDTVLTDIIMPEQDGIETIMQFRKKHPNLRIVAMSGGGRVSAGDYLPFAKHLGANSVLAKPFTDEELIAALAGEKTS